MPDKFKIVLLGAVGCGKSCLTIRYISGRFIGTYDPTIEDAYIKVMDVDDKPAVVDIIDTAGAEELLWTNTAHIKYGDAFLCVYAINDESSFKQAIQLTKEVLMSRSEEDGMNEPQRLQTPVILVGTKADLEDEREVTSDQGQHLAKLFDKTLNVCKFVETSARTGKNVDFVFQEAVRSVRQYRKANKQQSHRRSTCVVM